MHTLVTYVYTCIVDIYYMEVQRYNQCYVISHYFQYKY